MGHERLPFYLAIRITEWHTRHLETVCRVGSGQGGLPDNRKAFLDPSLHYLDSNIWGLLYEVRC